MSKNIILNCFMKIGDRVKMNWTDTSDGWDTRERKPNGTCGVVVGFHEYFVYYDVSNANGKKFGKYRCNGNPYVLWDDGESEIVSPHDICFEDPYYVHPVVDSEYCKLFQTEAFVEDLPTLPLMVGNHLLLGGERFNQHTNVSWFNQPMVIVGIDWNHVGTKCNDGITDYPIYRITPTDGTGGQTNVRFEDIVSCDPTSGNYWAWLNDKSKLSFRDLQDEVSFYKSLGKVIQVRNPATGNYGWQLEQVTEAIKAGTVDLLSSSGSLFGSTPFPVAYKVDEDLGDLGARCRAAFRHE